MEEEVRIIRCGCASCGADNCPTVLTIAVECVKFYVAVTLYLECPDCGHQPMKVYPRVQIPPGDNEFRANLSKLVGSPNKFCHSCKASVWQISKRAYTDQGENRIILECAVCERGIQRFLIKGPDLFHSAQLPDYEEPVMFITASGSP